jgi:predicted DNA binding protein
MSGVSPGRRAQNSSWTGSLSRECPSTRFRVLSAVPSDDAGFGLLEIESEVMPTVLDAIEGRAGVSAVELMQRTEDTAVVQFETSEPLLLPSVQEPGTPVELPPTIRDGAAVIELTASRDRLAEFGRQLEAFDMSYTLDRAYDAVDAPTLLTDQQRRLLVTAVGLGYYDTPRECTLTELAEEGEVDGECHAPPRGGDGRHGVRGRAPRRDARRTVNSGLEGQHRPETAENTSARRDAVLLEHRVKQVEKLRFGLEGPLRERVHGLRQRDAPSRPVVRDVGIAERPDDFVAGRRILEVGVIEMADQCGDAEFDRIR